MKKEHVEVKAIFFNTLIFIMTVAILLVFSEFLIRAMAPQNLTGQLFEYTDKGLKVNRSKGIAKAQYGNRIVNYRYYYPHLRDTPLQDKGIRILTVGDSFLFGILLDKFSVITYRLQQYADQEFGKGVFYFLNAGTGGWGTADYVAFVEDFGAEIKPDLVLVLMNTDDIGRSLRSNLFSITSGTKSDVKRNTLNINYIKKVINSVPGYHWLLEHSHLVQLLRKAWLLVIKSNVINKRSWDTKKGPNSESLTGSSEQAVKLGQALFVRLNEWCVDRAVGLCVTTTGWHTLKKSNSIFEPTREFMSSAPDFFKSISVPFYDGSSLVAEMRKGSGERYLLPDGHPNEEGDKLIAANIWQYFLRQQLIDYVNGKR